MRSLIAAAAAALIASASTAGAFFHFAWETQLSHQFKVEAYGWDLRVYEWQSKSDPLMACSAVYTDGGPAGYQCWNHAGRFTPPVKTD